MQHEASIYFQARIIVIRTIAFSSDSSGSAQGRSGHDVKKKKIEKEKGKTASK